MLSRSEYETSEIFLEYSKAPRPDKVHIGLVQLSTDHSIERDLNMLVGSSAMIFSNRVYYSSSMTPEALAEISRGITQSAGLIATGLPMDVMAFGCTSASIIIGNDKIRELLTVNNPGIPATNPWAGALAAFRHLQAKRVSIFSPYPTDVNYPLYQQLVAEGFEVPTIAALRIEKDTDITNVSFESMVNGAKRIAANSPTDALFMSCTNLRVLEHIKEIEAEVGIPIVTSTQAMFWHAMTLVGKQPRIEGFGQLLAG